MAGAAAKFLRDGLLSHPRAIAAAMVGIAMMEV
jgi:hypothetical protein